MYEPFNQETSTTCLTSFVLSLSLISLEQTLLSAVNYRAKDRPLGNQRAEHSHIRCIVAADATRRGDVRARVGVGRRRNKSVLFWQLAWA